MTNMKYLFGRIIVTVVTVFVLASCEPTYVDVYIKNATSQNIIFKGSVGECYNLEGVLLFTEDSIMVKSGEKALVIQYKDYEGFSGDYGMPWLMGCTYPNGITIEFEDVTDSENSNQVEEVFISELQELLNKNPHKTIKNLFEIFIGNT